ncbi:MAG TPA: flagellar basal body-associated FliL family protein [Myxococcales bacterium]|nr:flagellar basal body-associated FliL family protein [Myxococcales bacterium]HIN84984.1 flagellar basal body-associated FliL family protein [Myxococcales bacterium]
MAENDVQFEDGAQLQKGKGMLFAIVGVVIVLGGVGAYLATSGGDEAAAKSVAKPGQIGPIVALKPFVVNLNESGNRYLKVSISLEMNGEGMEDEVTKRAPKIRDRVIRYLVGLTLADVRGAETKDAILLVLLKKVNEAFGSEAMVKEVLFTEFVIQ